MEVEVRMIIEIMGRPALHIVSTLNALLDKMGAEKGITLVKRAVHNPVEVKDSQNLFSTFAEVEAKFDSIENYMNVIFGYMPANVEIISPESFKLTNDQLTYLGNLVVSRLHFYDSVAKQLLGEKEVLSNQLRYILETGKIPKIEQMQHPEKMNIQTNAQQTKKEKKPKKAKKKKK